MKYVIAKIVGIALMIFAVVVYLGNQFYAPDVNIFRFGGGSIIDVVSQLGLLGTIFHFGSWLVACVLGAMGWMLFSLEKLKDRKQHD